MVKNGLKITNPSRAIKALEGVFCYLAAIVCNELTI